MVEVALGLGLSKAARIRGWYRRIVFQQSSTRQRIRLIKAWASWPFTSFVQSRRATATFGKAVVRSSGISLIRQFLTQWIWSVKTGMPPEKYYALRLFLSERSEVKSDFLLSTDMHVVFMDLAHRQDEGDLSIISNKDGFARWCRRHDLPVPKAFAVFDGNGPTFLHPLPDSDLFSKPCDDRWGRNTRIWKFARQGFYESDTGALLSDEQLLSGLANESLKQPMILQERVQNHGELHDLTTGGLCTSRIVTSRPPGGDPQVIAAAFCMPIGSSPVSNFSHSVVAGVDLSTGILDAAIKKSTDQCTISFDRHPDTGGYITGRKLPFWSEMLELAIRAHRHVRSISSLGWDIALTDSGAMLIEVNVSWGLDTVQMPSGIPMGRTIFCDHYLEYVSGFY